MSQNSDFKHDSGFCAESSFCSNQKRKIKVKAFRPAQSIQCLTHLYPCTCIGQYSFLSNYALGYNLCSHVSNPYNSGAPAPNLRVTLIFNQNSTSGLWKKKTLPMQDRAFFFYSKCSVSGHTITEGNSNSIDVHFEIRPSQISAMPRYASHDNDQACACTCGLYRAACVAVNHSWFLPGGREDGNVVRGVVTLELTETLFKWCSSAFAFSLIAAH